MKVTTAPGSGEITEKKSRFLADVLPVHSAEEAENRIHEIQKRYWDARHHCYAFVIGPHRENSRCSDDGEPSGTAGKPILEVMNGASLTDTLIVVTRYFGGVLLGTGGLVRAYTQAAQAGLSNTPQAEQVFGRKISIDIDYTRFQILQHYFRQNNIITDDIEYGTDVKVRLNIISTDIERICCNITRITDGKAKITQGEEGFFLIRQLPV